MKKISTLNLGLSDSAQKVLEEIEEGTEENPIAAQEIKQKLECSGNDLWTAMIEIMSKGVWIQTTEDGTALWENTNETSHNTMSDHLYNLMVDMAKAIMGMDHMFQFQEHSEDLVANIFNYGELLKDSIANDHE